MKPFFSVIVPVYKVEEYLRPCVDSILAQSFADFELLLVDDGSPDGCGAVCDGYAAQDGRVTVIHQPNRGVTEARTAALDRAQGAFVCFVDGDDWVKENWLETVHGHLAEYPGADMLIFGLTMDDGHPAPPLPAEPGYYDKTRLEREIYPYMLWDRRKPFLTQHIPGYQCNKVYRSSLLREHFVRDRSITLYEDVAMVYECLYNAKGLYVCRDTLYVYRYRQGSAVLRYDPDDIRNMKACRDYLMAHLVRQAPDLQQQVDAFFMDKLLRAIAIEALHSADLRQAARHIGQRLDETGLARDLSGEGLPGRMRLFLGLLRHRAYTAAVLVHRARVWLYNHRPSALLGRRAADKRAGEG